MNARTLSPYAVIIAIVAVAALALRQFFDLVDGAFNGFFSVRAVFDSAHAVASIGALALAMVCAVLLAANANSRS